MYKKNLRTHVLRVHSAFYDEKKKEDDYVAYEGQNEPEDPKFRQIIIKSSEENSKNKI